MKWKKALLVIANLVLGTYLVFAFTVFNKPDETMRVCTKANISIDDERTGGFIDAQEISKRLKQADMFPLGKQMQHIKQLLTRSRKSGIWPILINVDLAYGTTITFVKLMLHLLNMLWVVSQIVLQFLVMLDWKPQYQWIA